MERDRCAPARLLIPVLTHHEIPSCQAIPNHSPSSANTGPTGCKLSLPDDIDTFGFGETYDEAMYKLIHKHLELDTHDRFAYVGANKGSFANKVNKKSFASFNPWSTYILD